MAGMINCMRFKPRDGQTEQMFNTMAEYLRDYPFDDILHAVIDLGNGEYALIGVHHTVDSFIEIMNRVSLCIARLSFPKIAPISCR